LFLKSLGTVYYNGPAVAKRLQDDRIPRVQAALAAKPGMTVAEIAEFTGLKEYNIWKLGEPFLISVGAGIVKSLYRKRLADIKAATFWLLKNQPDSRPGYRLLAQTVTEELKLRQESQSTLISWALRNSQPLLFGETDDQGKRFMIFVRLGLVDEADWNYFFAQDSVEVPESGISQRGRTRFFAEWTFLSRMIEALSKRFDLPLPLASRMLFWIARLEMPPMRPLSPKARIARDLKELNLAKTPVSPDLRELVRSVVESGRSDNMGAFQERSLEMLRLLNREKVPAEFARAVLIKLFEFIPEFVFESGDMNDLIAAAAEYAKIVDFSNVPEAPLLIAEERPSAKSSQKAIEASFPVEPGYERLAADLKVTERKARELVAALPERERFVLERSRGLVRDEILQEDAIAEAYAEEMGVVKDTKRVGELLKSAMLHLQAEAAKVQASEAPLIEKETKARLDAEARQRDLEKAVAELAEREAAKRKQDEEKLRVAAAQALEREEQTRLEKAAQQRDMEQSLAEIAAREAAKKKRDAEILLEETAKREALQRLKEQERQERNSEAQRLLLSGTGFKGMMQTARLHTRENGATLAGEWIGEVNALLKRYPSEKDRPADLLAMLARIIDEKHRVEAALAAEHRSLPLAGASSRPLPQARDEGKPGYKKPGEAVPPTRQAVRAGSSETFPARPADAATIDQWIKSDLFRLPVDETTVFAEHPLVRRIEAALNDIHGGDKVRLRDEFERLKNDKEASIDKKKKKAESREFHELAALFLEVHKRSLGAKDQSEWEDLLTGTEKRSDRLIKLERVLLDRHEPIDTKWRTLVADVREALRSESRTPPPIPGDRRGEPLQPHRLDSVHRPIPGIVPDTESRAETRTAAWEEMERVVRERMRKVVRHKENPFQEILKLPVDSGIVEPITVIPDAHGDLTSVLRILYAAGLIDENGAWIGGTRRVIQLGDVFNRQRYGFHLDNYLRALQTQAEAAGGRVIRLFGNHESVFVRGMESYDKFLWRWVNRQLQAMDDFRGLVNFLNREAFALGFGGRGESFIRGLILGTHSSGKVPSGKVRLQMDLAQESFLELERDIDGSRILAGYAEGNTLFTHAGVSYESAGADMAAWPPWAMAAKLNGFLRERDWENFLLRRSIGHTGGEPWEQMHGLSYLQIRGHFVNKKGIVSIDRSRRLITADYRLWDGKNELSPQILEVQGDEFRVTYLNEHPPSARRIGRGEIRSEIRAIDQKGTASFSGKPATIPGINQGESAIGGSQRAETRGQFPEASADEFIEIPPDGETPVIDMKRDLRRMGTPSNADRDPQILWLSAEVGGSPWEVMMSIKYLGASEKDPSVATEYRVRKPGDPVWSEELPYGHPDRQAIEQAIQFIDNVDYGAIVPPPFTDYLLKIKNKTGRPATALVLTPFEYQELTKIGHAPEHLPRVAVLKHHAAVDLVNEKLAGLFPQIGTRYQDMNLWDHDVYEENMSFVFSLVEIAVIAAQLGDFDTAKTLFETAAKERREAGYCYRTRGKSSERNFRVDNSEDGIRIALIANQFETLWRTANEILERIDSENIERHVNGELKAQRARARQGDDSSPPWFVTWKKGMDDGGPLRTEQVALRLRNNDPIVKSPVAQLNKKTRLFDSPAMGIIQAAIEGADSLLPSESRTVFQPKRTEDIAFQSIGFGEFGAHRSSLRRDGAADLRVARLHEKDEVGIRIEYCPFLTVTGKGPPYGFKLEWSPKTRTAKLKLLGSPGDHTGQSDFDTPEPWTPLSKALWEPGQDENAPEHAAPVAPPGWFRGEHGAEYLEWASGLAGWIPHSNREFVFHDLRDDPVISDVIRMPPFVMEGMPERFAMFVVSDEFAALLRAQLGPHWFKPFPHIRIYTRSDIQKRWAFFERVLAEKQRKVAQVQADGSGTLQALVEQALSQRAISPYDVTGLRYLDPGSKEVVTEDFGGPSDAVALDVSPARGIVLPAGARVDVRYDGRADQLFLSVPSRPSTQASFHAQKLVEEAVQVMADAIQAGLSGKVYLRAAEILRSLHPEADLAYENLPVMLKAFASPDDREAVRVALRVLAGVHESSFASAGRFANLPEGRKVSLGSGMTLRLNKIDLGRGVASVQVTDRDDGGRVVLSNESAGIFGPDALFMKAAGKSGEIKLMIRGVVRHTEKSSKGRAINQVRILFYFSPASQRQADTASVPPPAGPPSRAEKRAIDQKGTASFPGKPATIPRIDQGESAVGDTQRAERRLVPAVFDLGSVVAEKYWDLPIASDLISDNTGTLAEHLDQPQPEGIRKGLFEFLSHEDNRLIVNTGDDAGLVQQSHKPVIERLVKLGASHRWFITSAGGTIIGSLNPAGGLHSRSIAKPWPVEMKQQLAEALVNAFYGQILNLVNRDGRAIEGITPASIERDRAAALETIRRKVLHWNDVPAGENMNRVVDLSLEPLGRPVFIYDSGEKLSIDAVQGSRGSDWLNFEFFDAMVPVVRAAMSGWEDSMEFTPGFTCLDVSALTKLDGVKAILAGSPTAYQGKLHLTAAIGDGLNDLPVLNHSFARPDQPEAGLSVALSSDPRFATRLGNHVLISNRENVAGATEILGWLNGIHGKTVRQLMAEGRAQLHLQMWDRSETRVRDQKGTASFHRNVATIPGIVQGESTIGDTQRAETRLAFLRREEPESVRKARIRPKTDYFIGAAAFLLGEAFCNRISINFPAKGESIFGGIAAFLGSAQVRSYYERIAGHQALLGLYGNWMANVGEIPSAVMQILSQDRLESLLNAYRTWFERRQASSSKSGTFDPGELEFILWEFKDICDGVLSVLGVTYDPTWMFTGFLAMLVGPLHEEIFYRYLLPQFFEQEYGLTKDEASKASGDAFADAHAFGRPALWALMRGGAEVFNGVAESSSLLGAIGIHAALNTLRTGAQAHHFSDEEFEGLLEFFKSAARSGSNIETEKLVNRIAFQWTVARLFRWLMFSVGAVALVVIAAALIMHNVHEFVAVVLGGSLGIGIANFLVPIVEKYLAGLGAEGTQTKTGKMNAVPEASPSKEKPESNGLLASYIDRIRNATPQNLEQWFNKDTGKIRNRMAQGELPVYAVEGLRDQTEVSISDVQGYIDEDRRELEAIAATLLTDLGKVTSEEVLKIIVERMIEMVAKAYDLDSGVEEVKVDSHRFYPMRGEDYLVNAERKEKSFFTGNGPDAFLIFRNTPSDSRWNSVRINMFSIAMASMGIFQKFDSLSTIGLDQKYPSSPRQFWEEHVAGKMDLKSAILKIRSETRSGDGALLKFAAPVSRLRLPAPKDRRVLYALHWLLRATVEDATIHSEELPEIFVPDGQGGEMLVGLSDWILPEGEDLDWDKLQREISAFTRNASDVEGLVWMQNKATLKMLMDRTLGQDFLAYTDTGALVTTKAFHETLAIKAGTLAGSLNSPDVPAREKTEEGLREIAEWGFSSEVGRALREKVNDLPAAQETIREVERERRAVEKEEAIPFWFASGLAQADPTERGISDLEKTSRVQAIHALLFAVQALAKLKADARSDFPGVFLDGRWVAAAEFVEKIEKMTAIISDEVAVHHDEEAYHLLLQIFAMDHHKRRSAAGAERQPLNPFIYYQIPMLMTSDPKELVLAENGILRMSEQLQREKIRRIQARLNLLKSGLEYKGELRRNLRDAVLIGFHDEVYKGLQRWAAYESSVPRITVLAEVWVDLTNLAHALGRNLPGNDEALPSRKELRLGDRLSTAKITPILTSAVDERVQDGTSRSEARGGVGALEGWEPAQRYILFHEEHPEYFLKRSIVEIESLAEKWKWQAGDIIRWKGPEGRGYFLVEECGSYVNFFEGHPHGNFVDVDSRRLSKDDFEAELREKAKKNTVYVERLEDESKIPALIAIANGDDLVKPKAWVFLLGGFAVGAVAGIVLFVTARFPPEIAIAMPFLSVRTLAWGGFVLGIVAFVVSGRIRSRRIHNVLGARPASASPTARKFDSGSEKRRTETRASGQRILDRLRRSYIESFSGIRGSELGTDPRISAEDEAIAFVYGYKYAKFVFSTEDKPSYTFVAGRDPRPTGEAIMRAQIKGMLKAAREARKGIRFRFLDIVTTPMLESAVRTFKADGGFMTTASHNPLEQNGWKYLSQAKRTQRSYAFAGSVISAPDMQRIINSTAALLSENILGRRNIRAMIRSVRDREVDGIVHSGRNDSDFEKALAGYARELAAFVGEFNPEIVLLNDANGGSAARVNAEVLRRLGFKNVHSINTELGKTAHKIEPVGALPGEDPANPAHNATIDILPAMLKNHAQVGILYDFDADRGNLVILTPDGEVMILHPQDVAALAVMIELIRHKDYDRAKYPKGLAVVGHCATSSRTKEIAKALDASFFTVEVGETLVAGKMSQLEKEGYYVPIGVEGFNGGVVYRGFKCRDGLQTLLLAAKALSEPSIYREWLQRSEKIQKAADPRGETEEPFISEIVGSLPHFLNFQDKPMGVQAPPLSLKIGAEAEIQRRARREGEFYTIEGLPKRYKKVYFEYSGEDQKPREMSLDAVPGSGLEGVYVTGGWKLQLVDEDGNESCIWFRASKSEQGSFNRLVESKFADEQAALERLLAELWSLPADARRSEMREIIQGLFAEEKYEEVTRLLIDLDERGKTGQLAAALDAAIRLSMDLSQQTCCVNHYGLNTVVKACRLRPVLKAAVARQVAAYLMEPELQEAFKSVTSELVQKMMAIDMVAGDRERWAVTPELIKIVSADQLIKGLSDWFRIFVKYRGKQYFQDEKLSGSDIVLQEEGKVVLRAIFANWYFIFEEGRPVGIVFAKIRPSERQAYVSFYIFDKSAAKEPVEFEVMKWIEGAVAEPGNETFLTCFGPAASGVSAFMERLLNSGVFTQLKEGRFPHHWDIFGSAASVNNADGYAAVRGVVPPMRAETRQNIIRSENRDPRGLAIELFKALADHDRLIERFPTLNALLTGLEFDKTYQVSAEGLSAVFYPIRGDDYDFLGIVKNERDQIIGYFLGHVVAVDGVSVLFHVFEEFGGRWGYGTRMLKLFLAETDEIKHGTKVQVWGVPLNSLSRETRRDAVRRGTIPFLLKNDFEPTNLSEAEGTLLKRARRGESLREDEWELLANHTYLRFRDAEARSVHAIQFGVISAVREPDSVPKGVDKPGRAEALTPSKDRVRGTGSGRVLEGDQKEIAATVSSATKHSASREAEREVKLQKIKELLDVRDAIGAVFQNVDMKPDVKRDFEHPIGLLSCVENLVKVFEMKTAFTAGKDFTDAELQGLYGDFLRVVEDMLRSAVMFRDQQTAREWAKRILDERGQARASSASRWMDTPRGAVWVRGTEAVDLARGIMSEDYPKIADRLSDLNQKLHEQYKVLWQEFNGLATTNGLPPEQLLQFPSEVDLEPLRSESRAGEKKGTASFPGNATAISRNGKVDDLSETRLNLYSSTSQPAPGVSRRAETRGDGHAGHKSSYPKATAKVLRLLKEMQKPEAKDAALKSLIKWQDKMRLELQVEGRKVTPAHIILSHLDGRQFFPVLTEPTVEFFKEVKQQLPPKAERKPVYQWIVERLTENASNPAGNKFAAPAADILTRLGEPVPASWTYAKLLQRDSLKALDAVLTAGLKPKLPKRRSEGRRFEVEKLELPRTMAEQKEPDAVIANEPSASARPVGGDSRSEGRAREKKGIAPFAGNVSVTPGNNRGESDSQRAEKRAGEKKETARPGLDGVVTAVVNAVVKDQPIERSEFRLFFNRIEADFANSVRALRESIEPLAMAEVAGGSESVALVAKLNAALVFRKLHPKYDARLSAATSKSIQDMEEKARVLLEDPQEKGGLDFAFVVPVPSGSNGAGVSKWILEYAQAVGRLQKSFGSRVKGNIRILARASELDPGFVSEIQHLGLAKIIEHDGSAARGITEFMREYPNALAFGLPAGFEGIGPEYAGRLVRLENVLWEEAYPVATPISFLAAQEKGILTAELLGKIAEAIPGSAVAFRKGGLVILEAVREWIFSRQFSTSA